MKLIYAGIVAFGVECPIDSSAEVCASSAPFDREVQF